tara:strand:- start:342 stop:491 length:150 start_codon:yes stop_codon:yes gene_type:complete
VEVGEKKIKLISPILSDKILLQYISGKTANTTTKKQKKKRKLQLKMKQL